MVIIEERCSWREVKIERKGEILTSAPSANPRSSFLFYILSAIFLQTKHPNNTDRATCLARDRSACKIGLWFRDTASVSPLRKTVSFSLIVQFAMRQCLPL